MMTTIAFKQKTLFRLLKRTVTEGFAQDVPRLGAALAFYTLFAIAPLFVIVLAIAGYWFGQEAAREHLFTQLHGLLGLQGGEAIESMITAAHKPKSGAWATVTAAITLFAGATGVFVQLQDSLNAVWKAPKKTGGGLWNFVRERLLSFAMVVGMGFLLLVSLILSAGLAVAGKFMSGLLPLAAGLWQVINFAISFGVISLVFAVVFKVLPDVKLAWRDVWAGGLITALLFNLGKFFFGLYLGRGTVASAYGAAGSLVILLLWVYYSAQILFFGAKFTQIYAEERSSSQPGGGAAENARATASSRREGVSSGKG